MTHRARLAKLEEKNNRLVNASRTVCVYADDHTPEEIEAMRQDASIGTLIIVEYEDRKPISTAGELEQARTQAES